MNETNSILKTVITEFNSEIEKIDVCKELSLLRVEKGISLCLIFINKLRKIGAKEGINNQMEEILFFKEVKPLIVGHFLFFFNLQHILSEKPQGTLKFEIKYLKKHIKEFNSYLRKNREIYHYYKSGESKCDEQYFMRCNLSTKDYIHHPYSMLDSDFATSHDYTFANFRAHEMMLDYLKEEIKRLTAIRKKLPITFLEILKKSPYTWTAKKVSLTELIYALVECGCINNGDVDIKTLSNHACLMF